MFVAQPVRAHLANLPHRRSHLSRGTPGQCGGELGSSYDLRGVLIAFTQISAALTASVQGFVRRRPLQPSCSTAICETFVHEQPLIFPVCVLAVAQHERSSGRFEVARVEDPECSDCTLSIVVRKDEFKANDKAFVVLIGAQVPEELAKKSGWEGLLRESDFVLKPYYFGKQYLSTGLLLPLELVSGCVGDAGHLSPSELTAALRLRVSHHFEALRARNFFLEIGFNGMNFYGSQCTGNDEIRPTILGQVLKAAEHFDARAARTSSEHSATSTNTLSQWVTLSRVDLGVSARNFKLMTPPFVCQDFSDVAQVLGAKLPSSIVIHRAVPMPRGMTLGPSQEIVREYGYYFPACTLNEKMMQSLQTILQCFVGLHSFGNFTELKKLEGLKKKIQRSLPLQRFAHQLQSWKRSRKDMMQAMTDGQDGQGECVQDGASWVSSIRMHPAMREACKRHVLDITLSDLRGPLPKSNGLLCIHVKGHGFLYNMIRYIVGSALAVATGKLPAEVVHAALEGAFCVDLTEFLAPSHGLILLDQSLDAVCSWMPEGHEASQSADQFLEEKLIPEIEKAWQESGYPKKVPFAAVIRAGWSGIVSFVDRHSAVDPGAFFQGCCFCFLASGWPRDCALFPSLGDLRASIIKFRVWLNSLWELRKSWKIVPRLFFPRCLRNFSQLQ